MPQIRRLAVTTAIVAALLLVFTSVAMAKGAMPTIFYGDIIKEDDIQFGTYDAATTTFTPSPTSREAVLVEAFRISERSNTVASFILRIIAASSAGVRAR